MTLTRVWPALGLLGALATSASAQSAPGEGYAWVFPGVEFAACVDFLMSPELAGRQLTEGFLAVSAASFTVLSPVLRREIERDTALRVWIPAQICFLEAPSVSSGGAVLTPEGKMGARELLGYWAIAGTRSGGTPAFDQWYIAQYWTNDWRLRNRAEAAYVPMAVFKRTQVMVPETPNLSYTVTIGKTVLAWKGRWASSDSTAYAEPRSAIQILGGKRSIQWTATATTGFQWTRNLPGVFHVQGKDDLADALKASPIRMFGPMYWGGDARVEFSR